MRGLLKKIVATLLLLEARAVLRVYKPRIVAITGSVGKTSTKDAIYSVLAPHVFVRKSEKSFNSEIGIPLTILGRPNAWNNPFGWLENLIDGLVLIVWRTKYPEWLVLEVGADRPGDISSVAKWLRADIVVITRLPDVPVHVEFFDSPEDVIREKASLLRALKPDGTFVANADDEKVLALRDDVPGQSMTFGFSLGSDIHGKDLHLIDEPGFAIPVGIGATVETQDGSASAELRSFGTIGAHAMQPFLAAIAVSQVLGFDLGESAEALAGHTPPPGRMRLLPGLKGARLIDDTYNASPVATLAALDALMLAGKPKRTIAVLGDMMELGKFSPQQHREVGAKVAKTCDMLVTVGFRARDIAEGALSEGMPDLMIQQFEDAKAAGEYLQEIIEEGDLVLIKGSQSMRMERTVEELMLEPLRAKDLLVRQEAEWRKKR
jgi:UDP-N-acetylmuramoyl-tripeptide--D-alanyl-D-alanine ligase